MSQFIPLKSLSLPNDIQQTFTQQGIVDAQSAITWVSRLQRLDKQEFLTEAQIALCEEVLTPLLTNESTVTVPAHFAFGVLDDETIANSEALREQDSLAGKTTIQDVKSKSTKRTTNDDE
jgi:hypothetical protein